jgi:hypothetical protein
MGSPRAHFCRPARKKSGQLFLLPAFVLFAGSEVLPDVYLSRGKLSRASSGSGIGNPLLTCF